MVRRPLDKCPRCGSTEVSAERVRPLDRGSEIQEAYVWCPKCHMEKRTRLTTDLIEHQLKRFAACTRRVANERERNGRPSDVAVLELDNQADKLRNLAVRAGLASEIGEMCRLS